MALDEGWCSTSRPDRFALRKDSITCKGGRWDPGSLWKGVKNVAPTGIVTPNHPDPSDLLHRLRYPSPRILIPYTYKYYDNITLNRNDNIGTLQSDSGS